VTEVILYGSIKQLVKYSFCVIVIEIHPNDRIFCMDEYLYIKNFGPLKEIELKNIPQLTVFIGESGCGKSTVMKVLVLFRWIYKKICMRSYLKNAGLHKSPFKFRFDQYIRNNGFDGYIKSDSAIIYKRGQYEISYKNKKLDTSCVIDGNYISFDKMCFISDKRNLIPDLLAKKVKENINSFFLSETYNDFLEAAKVMDTLSIDYMDIQLIRKKAATGIQYYIKNKSGSETFTVRFEDASSGMQNTVPMEFIIEYFVHYYNLVDSFNKSLLSYVIESDNVSNFRPERDVGSIKDRNVFLHIEEPELSLYPDMQVNFMKNLIGNCFSSGKEYAIKTMLTTHSPYLVNYLNLAIKSKLILYKDVEAFLIHDGYNESLKHDAEMVIDAQILSDPIASIYEAYDKL
jgi:AAA15 family ATPase/GTPase